MVQGRSKQEHLWLPSFVFLASFSMATSEVYYILPPVQSGPCYAEHCFTLSQFVSNFTNYHKSEKTTLIFAQGNHSLESDLIVENIHSFSMFAELFSPLNQITCNLDTNFEFRNVGSVTINGLEFVECSENQLVSITRFQLTNSIFNSHPELDGTTLTIVESTAYLDRVSFLSTIDTVQYHGNTSMQPQVNCTLDSATIYRILVNKSVLVITHSLFDRSVIGVGAVIYSLDSSKITIFNSTFKNNRATCVSLNTDDSRGAVLRVYHSIMDVYDSRFEYNQGDIALIIGGIVSFTHNSFSNHFRLYKDYLFEDVIFVRGSNLSITYSMFVNNTITTVESFYSNITISNSKFIGNNRCLEMTGGQTTINHNIFAKHNGLVLVIGFDVNITFYHNKLFNNTANILIYLTAEKVTIHLNEFISNQVDFALVNIAFFTQPDAITNNIFIDNSAAYDIYINSNCSPGLTFSLGSSRCIKCQKNWSLNLVGLIIAAITAGIVLVTLMLYLNITVAVGTFNGILFYANIVAANTEAYFSSTLTPNFMTVFVSWLNLEAGFDFCAFEGMTIVTKVMLQLAFPAYVITLVIIIIVISEYFSRFAKIIGKGDPVAVLATMILLSYTMLFKAIIGSLTLWYLQPAYGSQNLNPTNLIAYAKRQTYVIDIGKVLLAISPIVLLLSFLYTSLVFSWQWLIQYQNKTIFKWVRYQKLQHFMAPYHAPYTTKYRYWTGVLLIARIVLFIISAANITRDPRVDFISTIFVIGCLILFKAVVAKRIYRNSLLDIMETAIFFNLVIFAAFTWYNLDFGGNQVAVAYISAMITFLFLLAVIAFHIVRFTSVFKLFKWAVSKVVNTNKTQEDLAQVEPGIVDGVQQQYITYSVLERPDQIQNETN